MKLTTEIDDTQESRPAKGTIEIKDVRVVNAPVLGKILTVGSLGGIVDLLRGDGIVFATVEGPFTYENGVFQTKDFRAVGSYWHVIGECRIRVCPTVSTVFLRSISFPLCS